MPGRWWRTSAIRLLLVLVAVTGCGDKDATAPASPSIVGQWEGTAGFGTVRFEATFTQTGETVGGTGQFSSPLGSGPFNISGTLHGKDVLLTLTSAEFGATTYTGRFTGANTIEGHLQSPDVDLTLKRN